MPDDVNREPAELDTLVRGWRHRVASDGMLDPPAIDELEDHLQRSMQDPSLRALSPTERFTIATCRIGHPDALVREFTRSSGGRLWSRRLTWMAAGVLGFLAYQHLTGWLFISALVLTEEVVLPYAGWFGLIATTNGLLIAGLCVGIVLLGRGRLVRERKYRPNASTSLGFSLWVALVVLTATPLLARWVALPGIDQQAANFNDLVKFRAYHDIQFWMHQVVLPLILPGIALWVGWRRFRTA
ncbi:MAG: hypothetical protein AAGE65_02985 [Planctomycetota bacterium]